MTPRDHPGRTGRGDRRGADQRFPIALASGAALLLLTGSGVPTGGVAPVAVSDQLPVVTPASARPPTAQAGQHARGSVGQMSLEVDVRSARLPTRSTSESAGSEPDRVLLRDLDIDLPVRPMGVAADGQMAMPDTVGTVGWYRYGSRPADRTGTTVLAGHVDTRTEGLGPFAALASTRTGMKITVEDRQNRRTTYRVIAVTRIGKHVTDLRQVFDRAGSPRLQIITCAGAYDPATGYHDYLIVTAVPV